MTDREPKLVQRLLRYYGLSCVLAGLTESHAVARL